MFKPNMRGARQLVFKVYLTLAVSALVVAGVCIAGWLLHREGFPQARWLWNVGIPQVARAVHADPWLLLAVLIVAAFVWCFPWEVLLQEFGQTQSPSNHRRGREVADSKEANSKAYQELLRRRTAKRTRQRSRRRY